MSGDNSATVCRVLRGSLVARGKKKPGLNRVLKWRPQCREIKNRRRRLLMSQAMRLVKQGLRQRPQRNVSRNCVVSSASKPGYRVLRGSLVARGKKKPGLNRVLKWRPQCREIKNRRRRLLMSQAMRLVKQGLRQRPQRNVSRNCVVSSASKPGYRVLRGSLVARGKKKARIEPGFEMATPTRLELVLPP